MNEGTTSAMTLVENERRRDRFIRRVNIIAWSISLSLILVIAVLVVLSISQFVGPAVSGDVPWMVLLGSAMPLIDVLWKLSLLVATLSTVALFVRLRTSSLVEIQLRLAALEEMIASGAKKAE
jgi:hypothetical protein